MFLVQALSRGAIAFFVIMSLGAGALQFRDGVNTAALGGLLDTQSVMASMDTIKGSLLRRLNTML